VDEFRLIFSGGSSIHPANREDREMSRLAATLLAISLAACASGCGTVLNLADKEPMAYGGLKRDFEWLEAFTGLDAPAINKNPQTVNQGRANWMLLGLSLLDPPLTIVGDTVTLPLTLWLENRRAQERSRESDGT
jgi:uncharacterized protein YceK